MTACGLRSSDWSSDVCSSDLAGPDDCEAAARWIAGSSEQLVRVVTGLALCGDSVGGTLSIVTAMALRDRAADVPLLAQFPLYPGVDLKTRYPSGELFGRGYFLESANLKWFNACYRPDLESWRASPLLGDQSGMPSTLILTAGLDPLRDHGRSEERRVGQEGVSAGKYRGGPTH